MIGLISNIRRRRAAEAALKESRARFHTLVETAPALIFATDEAGRNSFVNERYQSYTGLTFSELCGDGWLSVVHVDDRQAAESESAEAQAHPRPLERRLRIRRHDGEWRWFLSRTEPVAGASKGSDFAWLGISIDIDEQVHAEERERLLAQEVDHRAKNLLAVVQSVVQLTRADHADELKLAVTGRIQALARSHGLLAASRWQGVNLRALLLEELAAFTGRVQIEGPEVRLKPAAAQSIGLVVHELATNAAKYGCLSAPTGELQVAWYLRDVEERSHLELCWQERGGPPVTQPSTRGFGSTVIRSSVERQLNGKVTLDWEVEGLTCTLTVPTELLVLASEEIPRDVVLSPPVPLSSLAGTNILIVEDEVLIGLQMEDALTAAGCTVVGPVATVSHAVDLIVSAKPSAAILDVNLGAERSYPVADILAAKGIPFAFCTGYATIADLPERFRNAKVLPKPLHEAALVQALQQLMR